MKLKHRNLSRGLWLWPSVSCLMLIGMIAEARTHVQPTEAEPHLRRCREAIAAFPRTIETPTGTWTGEDLQYEYARASN